MRPVSKSAYETVGHCLVPVEHSSTQKQLRYTPMMVAGDHQQHAEQQGDEVRHGVASLSKWIFINRQMSPSSSVYWPSRRKPAFS